MNLNFVWSNLLSRPMRSLATTLAIALEVTLILMVIGLTQGMIRETTSRMKGIGADIVMQPPNSSVLMASSSAVLPVDKFVDLLRGIEGVATVSPVLVFWNTEKGSELIFGIDAESFNQISNGFIFLEGKGLEGEYDVLIDDIKASSKKLKVGDPFPFLNHTFRVCGIVEHGKGSRTFVPLKTLQNLVGSPGRATLMFLKCLSEGQINPTVARLQQRLPGYQIRPMGEFVSQMSEAYSSDVALRYFLSIVKFIAIVVGLFAIFLAMYTAITERTREIGILKSLGASRTYILAVFMEEAFLLCLLGFIFGIVLSYFGVWAIGQWSKNLPILLTREWIIKAGLITLASASVGAFYPAIRAANRDPIDALAFE